MVTDALCAADVTQARCIATMDPASIIEQLRDAVGSFDESDGLVKIDATLIRSCIAAFDKSQADLHEVCLLLGQLSVIDAMQTPLTFSAGPGAHEHETNTRQEAQRQNQSLDAGGGSAQRGHQG